MYKDCRLMGVADDDIGRGGGGETDGWGEGERQRWWNWSRSLRLVGAARGRLQRPAWS